MATPRYTSTLFTTITNILGPEHTSQYITNVISALRQPDVFSNRADVFSSLLRPFPAAAVVHNEIARITHDPESAINLPRVEADDASLRYSLFMVRLICLGVPANVRDVRWQVLGLADESVWQRRGREQVHLPRVAQPLLWQQHTPITVEEWYGDNSILMDDFQGEGSEDDGYDMLEDVPEPGSVEAVLAQNAGSLYYSHRPFGS